MSKEQSQDEDNMHEPVTSSDWLLGINRLNFLLSFLSAVVSCEYPCGDLTPDEIEKPRNQNATHQTARATNHSACRDAPMTVRQQ